MIGVTWEGWDGSYWNLRTGDEGVRMTDGGITGLRSLSADVFTKKTAVLDGQVFAGWKAKERELDFALDLSSPSSELDWLTIERSFFRTIRPDRPGRLTIYAPDGSARWISCRMGDSEDAGLGSDPAEDWGSVTVLSMIADDPWYISEAVHHEFADANAATRGFYPESGYGPPFYLAPATFTGSTTVTNPGDVDAWPTYTVTGPTEGFTINLNGRIVSGTFTIGAGASLVVDTNPQVQTATLYDAEGTPSRVTSQLENIQFAPIPDGDQVPISVLVYGTGTVSADFTPRYFRAW